MLGGWLRRRVRSAEPLYEAFSVIDTAELAPPTVEVEASLRSEMARARLDPGFLTAAAREMGWVNAEAMFASQVPRGIPARRGFFGEVLSSVLLRELNDYVVPVLRLRFAPHPDITPACADILAVRLDSAGKINEVCLVEVKLRTGRDRAVALVAANQLKKEADFDLPLSYTFTVQRLYEAGDPLFRPFARFLASRSANPDLQTARLFLVFDPSHWGEDCLEDLEAAEIGFDPLVVHSSPALGSGPAHRTVVRSSRDCGSCR